MDSYEIWVNLLPGTDDLDFVDAVNQYCSWFSTRNMMNSYKIRRRKFGFGPEGLGEFNISLHFDSLAQLDEAFQEAARRSGELEELHAAVYSKVTHFKSGLFRDFPDPVREPG